MKRSKDQQAVGPDGEAAKRPAVSGGGQLATRPAAVAATTPVKARKGKNAADDDDDLGDVEDILRRHGIT